MLAVLVFATAQGVGNAWADESGSQESSVTTGIQIVSQDGVVRQYEAHKLLSDSLAHGIVNDPSLEGCVPVSAFVKAGASKDDIATAENLAEWLAEKAANDSDGTFAVDLAEAVLQVESDKDLDPAATFSSGEVIGLSSGYWLMTSDDAQPMLAPVSAGEVLHAQEKSTVPVVEKTVDKGDAAVDSWSQNASVSVGDKVTYRLESTLPSNLASFSSYRLWLCDEISGGLEYDGGSVSSRIVHEDGSSEAVDLPVVINGQSMRVGADDLLKVAPAAVASDTVVVEYRCTVTSNASRGMSNGNGNTVSIEYRRSPTTDAMGTTSVSASADVYTFQIDIRQTDSSDKLMANASFVMQNEAGYYRTPFGSWSSNKDEAQVVSTSSEGPASFVGLGTGTYTLTETAVPEGYDPISQPITVTFAMKDEESESGVLKTAGMYGKLRTASADADVKVKSGSQALTASASGGGARIVEVDAADGVITVQVKAVVSSESENGSGANGSGSSGSDAGTAGVGKTSANKSSVAVPATGDFLLFTGVGLLAISVIFAVFGMLSRRAERNVRDDG